MNKDKLIQVMREAHKDAYCNADTTPEEAMGTALKALCKELPDVEELKALNSGSGLETMNDICRIYNQFKQWGNDE